MFRASVSVLFIVAGAALSGCGGDDTVNPTNPDASSATKLGDASSDGPKEGGSIDAAKDGSASKDSAGDEAGAEAGQQEAGGDT